MLKYKCFIHWKRNSEGSTEEREAREKKRERHMHAQLKRFKVCDWKGH